MLTCQHLNKVFRCRTFTTKQLGLGRPKEIAMLTNNSFLVSILVFNGLAWCFILFCLFKMTTRTNRQKDITKRKKLSDRKRISVIAEAIMKYRGECDTCKHIVDEIFHVISKDSKDVFLDIRNFLVMNVLPSSAETGKYQSLFDQTMKMYAVELNYIYKIEEKLHKKYSKEGVFPNSMSRDEIENIIEQKKDLMAKKERAEENFWSLCYSLSHFGFKTFDNFKAYLILKSSIPVLPLT